MNVSMEKHLTNCEEVGRRDMKLGQVLDFYNSSFSALFEQMKEVMNYLQGQIEEKTKGEQNE